VSDELHFESAVELARRLREREVSAVEVADAFLRRIDSENPRINAFTTVTHDLALKTARRCDEAAAVGRSLGILHGVPVAIKDLFDFRAGVRSTFGSLPLKDFVPNETTLYVQRHEDAGAVIVGKTNAPAFGHKQTGSQPSYTATTGTAEMSTNTHPANGTAGGPRTCTSVTHRCQYGGSSAVLG